MHEQVYETVYENIACMIWPCIPEFLKQFVDHYWKMTKNVRFHNDLQVTSKHNKNETVKEEMSKEDVDEVEES